MNEIIEEGLAAFIEFLIDEIGESVDPQTLIDRAFAQLKQMIDSSHFENPEDILKRISSIVYKRLQPGGLQ